MIEDIPFYIGGFAFFSGLLILISKFLVWMYANHQITGLAVALICIGIFIMVVTVESPPYEPYP
jgi:ABC-type uncharacterized transport system permease subunit